MRLPQYLINKIKALYLVDMLSFEEIASSLGIHINYIEDTLKFVKKPKRSKGEVKMLNILRDLFPGSKIEEQYHIKGLFFDFYVPKYKIAIEVDGDQHYKKIGFFHGEGIAGDYAFSNAIDRDAKKEQDASSNGIYLLRINADDVNMENVKALLCEHSSDILKNSSFNQDLTNYKK